MQTKMIRAQHLSTRHELVKGGEGAKRYTVALAEVTQTGRTKTVRHASTLGGSASDHARPSSAVESFDVRDRVRVLA